MKNVKEKMQCVYDIKPITKRWKVRDMDIEEAMELVKAGKATHHRVMLDKDGEITENEEEMVEFSEAVWSLEGELIVEVRGFKPTGVWKEIIEEEERRQRAREEYEDEEEDW